MTGDRGSCCLVYMYVYIYVYIYICIYIYIYICIYIYMYIYIYVYIYIYIFDMIFQVVDFFWKGFVMTLLYKSGYSNPFPLILGTPSSRPWVSSGYIHVFYGSQPFIYLLKIPFNTYSIYASKYHLYKIGKSPFYGYILIYLFKMVISSKNQRLQPGDFSLFPPGRQP